MFGTLVADSRTFATSCGGYSSFNDPLASGGITRQLSILRFEAQRLVDTTSLAKAVVAPRGIPHHDSDAEETADAEVLAMP